MLPIQQFQNMTTITATIWNQFLFNRPTFLKLIQVIPGPQGKPLETDEAGFKGWLSFLLPKSQCHSTEENSLKTGKDI